MSDSIGIFDSGLGGLTVVREVRARYPDREVFYLGDTARVPYGTKSAQTVERYSLKCLEFLLKKKVGLVLVACNTASAHALSALRAHTDVPIIGAVIPGTMAALEVSKNKEIAVLGTLGTIASKAYENAIYAREPNAKVVVQACPLFVPLAEEGWGESDIALAVAHRYLYPLISDNPQIDTLILGCTHYPLLRAVIEKVCQQACDHPIAIVDSGASMAKQMSEYRCVQDTGKPGHLHAYVTDATMMESLAPRFLGEKLESLTLVDI